MSASEMDSPTTVSVSCVFLDKPTASVRIELVFRGTCRAEFSVSHSDKEVVREEEYDWSEVPNFGMQSLDVSDPFQVEWAKTGFCPDSGMYEVKESCWVLDSPRVKNHKHFLILGHDVYVQVLAESWEWRLVPVPSATRATGDSD
jgi:hypothetical protein